MPYRLNNYRTTNDYGLDNDGPDRGILSCPGSTTINLYVVDAPIVYSFKPALEHGYQGDDWGEDLFLYRGFYFLHRRLTRIRVRSGIKNIRGMVTVEALKPYE